MTITKTKDGILFSSDKKHEPHITLSDNREADHQDLDRLIRAYPEDALLILMTCRNMGGAKGIMNKCRRRIRKKIKKNEHGIIHHIEGSDIPQELETIE